MEIVYIKNVWKTLYNKIIKFDDLINSKIIEIKVNKNKKLEFKINKFKYISLIKINIGLIGDMKYVLLLEKFMEMLKEISKIYTVEKTFFAIEDLMLYPIVDKTGVFINRGITLRAGKAYRIVPIKEIKIIKQRRKNEYKINE